LIKDLTELLKINITLVFYDSPDVIKFGNRLGELRDEYLVIL